MILFHCLNDSRRSTFQFTADAFLIAEETVWKENWTKPISEREKWEEHKMGGFCDNRCYKRK